MSLGPFSQTRSFQKILGCRVFTRQATRTLSSSWPPKLESATGRARKRRRRLETQARVNPKIEEETTTITSPKGWRVLWPNMQENQDKSKWAVPSREDFRRAIKGYKATWAAGLRGDQEVPGEGKDTDSQEGFDIKENFSRNSEALREEAQELGKELSKRSGIKNQEDLKNIATEIMKLATECLKEFMAGYRQGRDQEVEKMIHEYFQEEEQENKVHNVSSRRRRKPKRAVLRR